MLLHKCQIIRFNPLLRNVWSDLKFFVVWAKCNKARAWNYATPTFYLRYTGPWKYYFIFFGILIFPTLKGLLKKVFWKKKPFLRNFQSSYKSQQFDKILPYENFRQYYGCSLHIFPYFSTKNNFSHIVIPATLYSDRDIKMGHSTFFTTLKHGDIMLDVWKNFFAFS